MRAVCAMHRHRGMRWSVLVVRALLVAAPAGAAACASAAPDDLVVRARGGDAGVAPARADGGEAPDPAIDEPGAGPAGPSTSDAGATPDARAFTVAVDRAYLEARLGELTARERGSVAGRAAARTWLRQQYAALGLAVQEQAYAGGANVVADRPGTDPSRVLLVTAHYDSTSNAGADDDGSGVVSTLAIARALRAAPTRMGLRFVAFDQEEVGLVGSKAYVQALGAAGLGRIAGVVNLEMTGYDRNDDGRFHAMDCGRATSAPLAARIVEVAGSRPDLRLTKVDACSDRSDHASFWAQGVAAIVVGEAFFGGGGNPCYHQACDTVDRIDFDYMRRLTEAVALGVLRIAE